MFPYCFGLIGMTVCFDRVLRKRGGVLHVPLRDHCGNTEYALYIPTSMYVAIIINLHSFLLLLSVIFLLAGRVCGTKCPPKCAAKE